MKSTWSAKDMNDGRRPVHEQSQLRGRVRRRCIDLPASKQEKHNMRPAETLLQRCHSTQTHLHSHLNAAAKEMKPAQARVPNYRVSIHALKRRIVTRYAKNCLLLSLVYDRRCENRCASYSDTYFYHILTPIPAWRDTLCARTLLHPDLRRRASATVLSQA
jgi:hypothetical protein